MGQLLQFTRAGRLAASRPVQPQTVADLLLALEEAPLAAMQGAVTRRLGGHYVVIASTACGVFELTADEARLAAHALFSEQAYVGCIEASVCLMDLARKADAMMNHQGVA